MAGASTRQSARSSTFRQHSPSVSLETCVVETNYQHEPHRRWRPGARRDVRRRVHVGVTEIRAHVGVALLQRDRDGGAVDADPHLRPEAIGEYRAFTNGRASNELVSLAG
jgi:hypothetical protein